MKQAIFIYNPLSGDRTITGKLDYIIECFQQSGTFIQPYRIDSESLEFIPKLLQQNDYTFAVIAGGDGTLNTIIDLILKINPNLPVGIIPSGTSNDLARCLGIKSSIDNCLDVILNENMKAIDVGLIDDEKYFFSCCAGGLFVDASFNTDNELKKSFGPLAYYLKALSDVANVKPVTITIKTENEIYHEDVLLFMILNGNHAAGFTNIIEEADITDGIMDIILIKNCSHLELASLFLKVLSADSLKDSNVVKIRTSECIFECDCNINISIDGEDGGKLPHKIKFEKQLLNVFVPYTNSKLKR